MRDDHLGLKGRHHVKNGDLDSDPITRVQSGWWERPDGKVVVYVVMLAQPRPGSRPRQEAGTRLDETARQITAAVVESAAGSRAR